MSQPFRIGQGGRIDREQEIQFTFNGKSYTGLAGRYAVFGVARQWRAPGRAQLEVSSPAWRDECGGGRTERDFPAGKG